MHSVICDAIRDKVRMEFYYDGGVRIVEPHCYGRSAKGNDVLRAYQVAGHSDSGKPEGWKLFDMAKAGSVVVSSVTFARARDGYNPADRAMITVYRAL